MTDRLQIGDLVIVSDKVRRHKGKIGSVASVTRVNPRKHLVVVGEETTTRVIRGKEQSFTVPVTEERPLAPVIEIGVDFIDPAKEGELRTQLWFRPDELSTTGKRSKRTAAEKGATS